MQKPLAGNQNPHGAEDIVVSPLQAKIIKARSGKDVPAQFVKARGRKSHLLGFRTILTDTGKSWYFTPRRLSFNTSYSLFLYRFSPINSKVISNPNPRFFEKKTQNLQNLVSYSGNKITENLVKVQILFIHYLENLFRFSSDWYFLFYFFFHFFYNFSEFDKSRNFQSQI